MPKTKAENQNVPKERQKLPAKTKPKPSRKHTNSPDHSGLRGQDLVARTWWPELGGGGRDRTDDLLLAKQALSQLSYTPSY
jgi:hypothetical protein